MGSLIVPPSGLVYFDSSAVIYRVEKRPDFGRMTLEFPGIMPRTEAPMAIETTSKSWVQKTPNVCGGDACIRNTRITVHGLVHYRQLGLSDRQILDAIPGLTPEDLEAAWEYQAGHAAEIAEAIRLNEEA